MNKICLCVEQRHCWCLQVCIAMATRMHMLFSYSSIAGSRHTWPREMTNWKCIINRRPRRSTDVRTEERSVDAVTGRWHGNCRHTFLLFKPRWKLRRIGKIYRSGPENQSKLQLDHGQQQGPRIPQHRRYQEPKRRAQSIFWWYYSPPSEFPGLSGKSRVFLIRSTCFEIAIVWTEPIQSCCWLYSNQSAIILKCNRIHLRTDRNVLLLFFRHVEIIPRYK